MKKILTFLFLTSTFLSGKAQITKIEHFNAHATEAPALFELFKTQFKWPVVYDYQNYGGFSSGGLWLGNITFEFVNFSGNPYTQAVFKGIALEPKQHTDGSVPLLDENKVAYFPPSPTTFRVNGEEKTFWINTVLKDLTSPNVRVLICDYQDRAYINNLKKVANDALLAENGGNLGIIGLKSIVFSVKDVEKSSQVWGSIPGSKSLGNNQFQFVEGPNLNLEKSDKEGVKEIIVQVKSKEKAVQFLEKNQFLLKEGNAILINPDRIAGLRIILEE